MGDPDFSAAVALVLEREGVLSDDKADPGGLTKFGISQAAYPNLDIARLTREEAIAIYRRDYWDRCRCGELPWSLALVLFDAAVQHGTGTAVRLLQRALGLVEDGALGPVTLAKVKANRPDLLLELFQAERAIYYADLAGWPRFRRGWSRRLVGLTIRAAAAF